MRKKDRILSIRKHSKERVPKESLWFFNEGSSLNSPEVPERNTAKRGIYKEIKEDYDPFMSKISERSSVKKEILFVVDWQMTESF